jgi:uncharacterized protein YjbJ (UPF0337 family)
MMNRDLFERRWKQMRGQAKEWWNTLTDDDLDRVAGDFDKLIGLLQEKQGYTRERAEEDFNRRMALLLEKRVEDEFARRLAKLATRRKSGVHQRSTLQP